MYAAASGCAAVGGFFEKPPFAALRNPVVRAEIRREASLLAQHPDNAAIDEWIDAVYDWTDMP